MASTTKRGAKAKSSTKRRTVAPRALWMGCFEVVEDDADQSEASFQILVRGPSPAAAATAFKERIRKLRRKGTLFSEACTIFVRSIIEWPEGVNGPVLVNYATELKNRVTLHCDIPDQADAGDLNVFGADPEAEDDDVAREVEPFVQFKTAKKNVRR